MNMMKRPMRLLLVMPDAGIHKLSAFGWSLSFRDAPLTMSTLAALVPDSLGVDVRIVDESVESYPHAEAYDLVGISCLTGTAHRAYELAAHYRGKGSTVILGGVHVTLCPEEAAGHADAIVTGFAEEAWPTVIQDAMCGRLKPRYEGGNPSLDTFPDARRDLMRMRRYMVPNSVFATRGCKGACEFCSVPAAGVQWRTRPVEDVVREVASLPGRRFGFNDVSITEDREYALKLFRGLAPLKKTWGGLATSRIAEDPELLKALAESGCQYLLIGLESVRPGSLRNIHKSFNKVDEYSTLITRLHDHGICVQGCFIFGMDDDTADIFSETAAFVNEIGVDIPRYAVFTPYPGTKAFDRLHAEGRLLHTQWRHYDTQHVVFKPKNMTPEELDEGFKKAYDLTFSMGPIWKRCRTSPQPIITFLGNLAYRRYLKRLKADSPRILKEARS